MKPFYLEKLGTKVTIGNNTHLQNSMGFVFHNAVQAHWPLCLDNHLPPVESSGLRHAFVLCWVGEVSLWPELGSGPAQITAAFASTSPSASPAHQNACGRIACLLLAQPYPSPPSPPRLVPLFYLTVTVRSALASESCTAAAAGNSSHVVSSSLCCLMEAPTSSCPARAAVATVGRSSTSFPLWLVFPLQLSCRDPARHPERDSGFTGSCCQKGQPPGGSEPAVRIETDRSAGVNRNHVKPQAGALVLACWRNGSCCSAVSAVPAVTELQTPAGATHDQAEGVPGCLNTLQLERLSRRLLSQGWRPARMEAKPLCWEDLLAARLSCSLSPALGPSKEEHGPDCDSSVPGS